MIANPAFFIRDKVWQGLKLDNITFVLNAVDELAGEDALLTLRSRQAVPRTLTAVAGQHRRLQRVAENGIGQGR